MLFDETVDGSEQNLKFSEKNWEFSDNLELPISSKISDQNLYFSNKIDWDFLYEFLCFSDETVDCSETNLNFLTSFWIFPSKTLEYTEKIEKILIKFIDEL